MSSLKDISQKIESLRRLSDNEAVYLDDVQQEFRLDLQTFIVGETMTLREGRLLIGKAIFRQWLDKIRTRGFDYEIDFKQ